MGDHASSSGRAGCRDAAPPRVRGRVPACVAFPLAPLHQASAALAAHRAARPERPAGDDPEARKRYEKDLAAWTGKAQQLLDRIEGLEAELAALDAALTALTRASLPAPQAREVEQLRRRLAAGRKRILHGQRPDPEPVQTDTLEGRPPATKKPARTVEPELVAPGSALPSR
jgi:hypothetical protein